jgi:hypothetical protein
MNKPQKNRPSHDVFVVEGEGDSAYSTRVGRAWAHDDGKGFNISLTALPLNGKLVIREPKPKAAGR